MTHMFLRNRNVAHRVKWKNVSKLQVCTCCSVYIWNGFSPTSGTAAVLADASLAEAARSTLGTTCGAAGAAALFAGGTFAPLPVQEPGWSRSGWSPFRPKERNEVKSRQYRDNGVARDVVDFSLFLFIFYF